MNPNLPDCHSTSFVMAPHPNNRCPDEWHGCGDKRAWQRTNYWSLRPVFLNRTTPQPRAKCPKCFVVCAYVFFFFSVISSGFFFDHSLCAYSNRKSSAKHANWLMKFLLGRTCGDRGNGYCGGPVWYCGLETHRPW